MSATNTVIVYRSQQEQTIDQLLTSEAAGRLGLWLICLVFAIGWMHLVSERFPAFRKPWLFWLFTALLSVPIHMLIIWAFTYL